MLYETLFEAIDEAVCFLEKLPTRLDGRRDFRYVAANRAMRDMFGLGDLTGRSGSDTFADDSDVWYDDFDRVLATGEALAVLQAQRPDVIISDVGMPGQDGYELIRRIRALPPEDGGRTPAIALTAYARAEDRVRAVAAGFQQAGRTGGVDRGGGQSGGVALAPRSGSRVS